jgi:hypothetical protein
MPTQEKSETNGVEWVEARPVAGVKGIRAHAKFIHISLAYNRAASLKTQHQQKRPCRNRNGRVATGYQQTSLSLVTTVASNGLV